MPSLPRLLIATVFVAVAIIAIVTIVRPRSRMSFVTLIAAFFFYVAAPGGDTTTRVWASAVALFSLVFAAMALWYHTLH